jgi:hypothetical protein
MEMMVCGGYAAQGSVSRFRIATRMCKPYIWRHSIEPVLRRQVSGAFEAVVLAKDNHALTVRMGGGAWRSEVLTMWHLVLEQQTTHFVSRPLARREPKPRPTWRKVLLR